MIDSRGLSSDFLKDFRKQSAPAAVSLPWGDARHLAGRTSDFIFCILMVFVINAHSA